MRRSTWLDCHATQANAIPAVSSSNPTRRSIPVSSSISAAEMGTSTMVRNASSEGRWAAIELTAKAATPSIVTHSAAISTCPPEGRKASAPNDQAIAAATEPTKKRLIQTPVASMPGAARRHASHRPRRAKPTTWIATTQPNRPSRAKNGTRAMP